MALRLTHRFQAIHAPHGLKCSIVNDSHLPAHPPEAVEAREGPQLGTVRDGQIPENGFNELKEWEADEWPLSNRLV